MSQQINLYDVRLWPRRLLVSGKRVALAAVAVIVLSMVWAAWANMRADRASAEAARVVAEVKDWQSRHDALAKQIADKRLPPALQNELDTTRAIVAVRQEVVGLLDSGRLGTVEGFSGIFSGFSRQADRDLWLTGFVVSRGGQEIEIRGKLFDSTRLPGYVQRLSADPVFKGRRFAALTMDSIDPQEAKPGVVAGSGPAAPVLGEALKLPRHIEFVLRSEHAGDAVKSSEAGK